MNYSPWKALLWVAAYVVLVLAPLVVAYAGVELPSRGFWIEFGVGLGFVGLAMMALQFVLTGRFRYVAESLGLDSMLHFHRQIGLAGFFLVLAHPIVLIAAHPAYISFLDPRINPARAAALVAVVAALVFLIVTTLWRQRLRIAYEWWRLGHGVLAFLVVFIGLVHVLQVQYYVSVPWKQALWFILTGGVLVLLLNTRLVKPLRMRRRPWRIVDVREERGPSHTLVLEPVGHGGFRFTPGQFAWLTVGPSPFSLQQHPFSFCSSAEDAPRVAFTIKELGDFTSTVGEIKPGTPAFVEGPYGAFTPDPDPSREVAFIVAGVGVTPVMCMLRTFRDRGERRRISMLFANISEETSLYLDELESLERDLELDLTLVYEKAPPGWTGESGLITPAILDRRLPAPDRRRQYFVCGPPALMDLVERHLRRSGVPMRNILSERFQIV